MSDKLNLSDREKEIIEDLKKRAKPLFDHLGKEIVKDIKIDEVFGKENKSPFHTEPRLRVLANLPNESKDDYEKRKANFESMLPIPHNEGGPIPKEFLGSMEGKDWDELRNHMADKIDQELFKDITKQSEMKSIEIDWKKIYEINPDGLLEFLQQGNNKITSISWTYHEEIQYRIGDFKYGFYNAQSLNSKALGFILWLDSKGVYLFPIPYYNDHKEVIEYDKWSFRINRRTIDADYPFPDRQTAIAAGILKAFELLKDKT